MVVAMERLLLHVDEIPTLLLERVQREAANKLACGVALRAAEDYKPFAAWLSIGSIIAPGPPRH